MRASPLTGHRPVGTRLVPSTRVSLGGYPQTGLVIVQSTVRGRD